MGEKKEITEIKVHLDTKSATSTTGRLKILELVAEKIKTLEEKGEYKCTLLEVEI